MSASEIFKKSFSLKNLIRLYSEKVISSSAIGIDRVRPRSIESHVKDEALIIKRKVMAGSYRFTPYKEKLISKGASSLPRQISIPTARDRITLRALCELLSRLFVTSKMELPQTAIESLKEALNSKKYTHYIKIDLKDFYPTLPHDLVMSAIKRKIRKHEIVKLIISAISTPTVNALKGGRNVPLAAIGVPQGLAISNILAEIALGSFDQELISNDEIWYKRYVDDILILCTSKNIDPKSFANDVVSMLRARGLNPHEMDKINSKSKVDSLAVPFTYLGYEISDGRVKVKKENICKFESSIAKILTRHKHSITATKEEKRRSDAYCQWRINLRISGCVMKGARRGWVAYFSQISGTSQLHHLNKVVNKLICRFNLKGEIKPKSLVKTFYEVKHRNMTESSYIPNFDTVNVDTKREILELWYAKEKINNFSNDDVIRLFEAKISKEVDELEQDITSIS